MALELPVLLRATSGNVTKAVQELDDFIPKVGCCIPFSAIPL